MDTIPYSDLIPTDYTEDERQDAYLALLEGKPSTSAEALSLIQRCHWRSEYHRRENKRRAIQFLFDPTAPPEVTDGLQVALWAAIGLLDTSDAELIRLRISEDYSVIALAAQYKVSRATINWRLERITNKLREICSKM